MKKLSCVLFAALFCVVTANAQFFEKGTNVVSVGIGLGSSLGNFTYGSQSPAFSAQYERGIWPIEDIGVISLGGYVGRKTYKYSSSDMYGKYEWKWNYTIVGVRSAFHYNKIDNEKLDVYGGVMLSYNHVNFKSNYSSGYTYNGNYNSTVGLMPYLGGRYLFTNNLGAFAEVGYGIAYLNLGLALKF